MTELRLLLVSGNTYGPESFDNSTGKLWAQLAQRSDAVAVFARSKDQKFRVCSKGRVTLYLVPKLHARQLSFLFSSWLIVWAMVAFRPTVIQCQSPVYGGLAAVGWSRLTRVPILAELHGEHYVRPGHVGGVAFRYFFRPLAAVTLRRAEKIRSLAPGMTKALVNVYGPAIGEKVVEIGNRVDLAIFSPPKGDYLSHDPMRAIMVGTLNVRKNQVQLVQDMASTGVRASLVFAGDGPDRAMLEGVATRYSSVEVTILGETSHERLVEQLREADVYLHYSNSEAVPRAVLEAMAMGLPVVAGPSGFLEGILQDGVNGFVLSDLSPESLKRVWAALSSDVRRRSMGEAGRRYIEEHHDSRLMFDRHVTVLRVLAATRNR